MFDQFDQIEGDYDQLDQISGQFVNQAQVVQQMPEIFSLPPMVKSTFPLKKVNLMILLPNGFTWETPGQNSSCFWPRLPMTMLPMKTTGRFWMVMCITWIYTVSAAPGRSTTTR